LVVVVAITIGGEGLLELGSDVARDLTVEIVAAVLLLVIGGVGFREQVRRSGDMRDEVIGESDQPRSDGR
jgi:hypothetical protein